MKKLIIIGIIAIIFISGFFAIKHFTKEKIEFVEPNKSDTIVKLKKGKSLQSSIWVTNDINAKVKSYYFGNDNVCTIGDVNGTYRIENDTIYIKMKGKETAYSFKNIDSEQLIIDNIAYSRRKNCD